MLQERKDGRKIQKKKKSAEQGDQQQAHGKENAH
jgi:hypothetical protein